MLKIEEQSIAYKAVQLITTFVLVDFSWIFFRANGVSTAVTIAARIFSINKACFDDMISQLNSIGLDKWSVILIAVCFLILFFADICKKREISISKKIMNLPWMVQSCLIVLSICAILVFGIWGPEYNQANFIYFQF